MIDRILFIAELYNRKDWEPVLSTTPNNYDREYNVYYFDTAQNNDSYWVTTWGGTFDTIDTTNIQILLDQYLVQVFSKTAVELTENSFYVDGTEVYINVPKKPWQYYEQFSEVDVLEDGHDYKGRGNCCKGNRT